MIKLCLRDNRDLSLAAFVGFEEDDLLALELVAQEPLPSVVALAGEGLVVAAAFAASGQGHAHAAVVAGPPVVAAGNTHLALARSGIIYSLVHLPSEREFFHPGTEAKYNLPTFSSIVEPALLKADERENLVSL